jgi:hypothetical protein
MANDEHVAMLKKGVDAWNAWREENPDIRPDLSEAAWWQIRPKTWGGVNSRMTRSGRSQSPRRKGGWPLASAPTCRS